MASEVATTTVQQWCNSLQDAQKNAAEGAKQEFAKDYNKAFTLYVRAGETYLWLARTYDDVKGKASSSTQAALLEALPTGDVTDVKGRIRRAADKVLRRAQLIKRFRTEIEPLARKLTSKEEQARALRSVNRMHGVTIPLWQGVPDVSLFKEDTSIGVVVNPQLSPTQLARRATFRGRSDGVAWSQYDLYTRGERLGGRDILQDIVNDCSFVAAMEVAAEHDKRFGTTLALSPLYPKEDDGRPRWSSNGRHLVRLRLNGADRSVTIDESLPCLADGTPLCAVGHRDQTHSSPDSSHLALWPALLEKAFLSVHGGYDFAGSNAAADLYTLTGWIPEDIGFHRADFQREKIWKKLQQAHNAGSVMCTAGTARHAADSPLLSGESLVNLHNYAILDMTEDDRGRHITLMNPWRRCPADAHELEDSLAGRMAMATLAGDDQSGIMVMSWDEACSRLDTLYLSWDPSKYRSSDVLHALWLPQSAVGREATTTQSHVQILLDVGQAHDGEDEILIHLERHLTDAESDLAKPWIALHAFSSSNGQRDYSPRCTGSYVDGAHMLLRYRATTGMHTIVASLQLDAANERTESMAFTMRAHSNRKVTFKDPADDVKTTRAIAGRWSSKSAGGNAQCSTFVHNPQYLFSREASSRGTSSFARWVLETSRDVAVQIAVVWATSTIPYLSNGKDITGSDHRIDHLEPGQVVCTSGDYTYGLAIAEMVDCRVNTPYVVIVSTYSPGTEADFVLRLQTNAEKVDVRTIAAEGAGMHQQRERGAWSIAHGTARGAPRFGSYRHNPTYVLSLEKAGNVKIRLVSTSTKSIDGRQSEQRSTPHINVSLFDLTSAKELATSGAYENRICGVLVNCDKLEAGDYLVVVSTFEANVEASYALQTYSDSRVTLKPKP
jgi:calpain-7